MNLKEILLQSGIRPSVQRLEILSYLTKYRTHPTVDEIFSKLIDKIPTLSKTTVYNTLALFIEKGIVNTINIDEKNQRYDATTELHAHFLCDKCGMVYDFPYRKPLEIPEGFIINETQILHKGTCNQCNNNK